MYYITKEEGLVGKEILFTHMAQFAQALTIVTTDKGVFVVEQSGDRGEETITTVYSEGRAREYILRSKWLRENLHEKGVLTHEEVEAYEEGKRQEVVRRRQEEKQRQEEKDRREFERLSAKFKPKE